MRLFDARVACRSSFGVVLLLLCLLPVTSEAQEFSDYFTVTPCRLYDSRWGAGPLAGGLDRWIPAGGYCGIPPDATAATLNVTSVTPTGNGLTSAYPCCTWTNTIVNGFQSGNNVAGNAMLRLGEGGKLAAYLNASFSTTADLVVDVSGYFRPISVVQQWREWEGTLTSPEDYTTGDGDPYADVVLDIRFTNGATGAAFVQPAVWDGDELMARIFKVYTALPPGTWTWAIDKCMRNGVSCQAGWAPSTGTILVQSNTASGNPLFDRGFIEQVETVVGGQTVAVSELKFPDGLSFAWVGDTAWVAPPREKSGQTASWNAYVADRKAKGFTAVQIAPAVAWTVASPLPAPKDFSFTLKNSCPDAATPIPNTNCWKVKTSYWKYFKQMVQKANNAGLLVAVLGVMNPVGIDTDQAYPNTSGAIAFARYLKGLLGGQSVIFSPGFDDDADQIDPATHQPRSVLMNAVGNELKGLTPSGKKRPVTNHLAGGRSNCDEYLSFAQQGWMTHYLFQSGHGSANDTTGACAVSGSDFINNAMERARVMPRTLSGYSPKLPAVNAEGPYDALNYTGYVPHPDVDTRYRVRQAGYLNSLSNAVGYTYGAYGITSWVQPNGFFSLPSAQDMGVLKSNLLGLHLVEHPDWIGNNPTIQKYKMVLATDEVSLVLAYMPGDEGGSGASNGTIVIDSSKLPCQVCPAQGSGVAWSYRWLNPVSGLQGTGVTCSGQKGAPLTFQRPSCSSPSANENCDWLLRIEKTGVCPSALDPEVSSEATLQAWTEAVAGDSTSAVYAGAPGLDDEPVLLSPPGKAFQIAPRVGRVGSRHLVVWQADGLDGSLYGIYGALVGSRQEVTGPFKINHYTEHDQREPAVASGIGQEALVVWSSYGQDGDRGGIFGRFVKMRGRDGERSQEILGEEFRISESGAGHQRAPQVVADAGGYWVAWETQDEQAQVRDLSVRRLDRSGHPQTSEVRLSAPAGEGRKLLALDRPVHGSVVLRWWRQDARGGVQEILEQEVGPHGVLGPVAPGKE